MVVSASSASPRALQARVTPPVYAVTMTTSEEVKAMPLGQRQGDVLSLKVGYQ